MSAKSSQPVKVFYAGIVMTVDNIESKFASNQVVYSDEYSCPHDPDQLVFKAKLTFGAAKSKKTKGTLGAHFHCITQKITCRRFKITIIDEEGSTVAFRSSTPCFCAEYRKEAFCGWNDAFTISSYPSSKDATWNVILEIAYGGSPTEKSLVVVGDADLSDDYLQLLEDAPNADFTFTVSGEDIKAHKAILAARSTYFKNMFQTDMKENLTDKVEVPDADPNAFRGMLQYIYGGMAPKNLEDIAIDLFAIADKYGLDTLKDMCESSICRNLDIDTVIDALILAERYNLEALMSQAKLVLKGNIHAVDRSEENRKRLKDNPDFLYKLFVQFVSQ